MGYTRATRPRLDWVQGPFFFVLGRTIIIKLEATPLTTSVHMHRTPIPKKKNYPGDKISLCQI